MFVVIEEENTEAENDNERNIEKNEIPIVKND